MGPVRFGDQKENFNWNILSKCCRNDGVILKPDVPAAPIDIDLAGLGNRKSGLGKGEEIRWQTYAEIEERLSFMIVFFLSFYALQFINNLINLQDQNDQHLRWSYSMAAI